MLEHNLRLFDQLEKRCGDTDSCLEEILRWREYTMHRLRYTEKEIDLLWLKYRQYSFARNRELNRYMEHQKYGQATDCHDAVDWTT